MGKVHLLPGTTFSDSKTKGDYDPAKHATMTLPEFERWLALEIACYHNTRHRTLETAPRAAWQADLQQYGEPRSVVNPQRRQPPGH